MNFFYGNGTSYVVKKNAWRDKKLGVITDLGSHLLNLCIFWFGTKIKKFKLISVERFENKSPDHAVILLEINISIVKEMVFPDHHAYKKKDRYYFPGHKSSASIWGSKV